MASISLCRSSDKTCNTPKTQQETARGAVVAADVVVRGTCLAHFFLLKRGVEFKLRRG